VSGPAITVRIACASLLRAHDGADLEETGAAFLRALEPVLRREIPELAAGRASLALSFDVAARGHQVEVRDEDEARARRVEREVRDVIWVVREMVPFAVLG
jgi:hypothetical protein